MLNKFLSEINSSLDGTKDLSFMTLNAVQLTRMETTIVLDLTVTTEFSETQILRLMTDVKTWIDTTNFVNFIFKFSDLSMFSVMYRKTMADKLFYLNFNDTYKTSIDDQKIVITFEDNNKELKFKTEKRAKKRFESFYSTFGFKEFAYKHETETTVERKKAFTLESGESDIFENRSKSSSGNINTSKAKLKTAKELYNTKEFKISELPFNVEELDSFNEHIVKIEGEIFDVTVLETKRCNIVTYEITDYLDSIQAKMFINKSDIPTTTVYKIGDTLSIKGEVKYDKYSRDLTLSILDNGIMRIEKEYKKDFIIEEQKDFRTELHIHSKMSTRDGLNDITDYFKNAKKYGIKALAITDHENVQSFPDAEKIAKQTGIKPLYGCEFNAYDEDDFKIVYNRTNTTGTEKDYVGVDIETTGLSNQFDDIIEIACYKTVDGVEKSLDLIVRPTDMSKMSQKIVDLTSIDEELINSEGIDVKDALRQFVAFMGDDYIVAHNANFDVPFLEEKIKTVLGIDKTYDFIDTLSFSKVILKDESKRFGLSSVAKKLKCTLEQHHRAVYDAMCCYDIYNALIDRTSVKHYKNLDELDKFPYTAVVKYNSFKKETELLSLIKDNEIKILSVEQIEKHTEETGKIIIDTNKEFIEGWEETIPYFIPYENKQNTNIFNFEYTTPEELKLIKKIRTKVGGKKNVKSFEIIVASKKHQGSKGNITVTIETKEELKLLLPYGIKEVLKTNLDYNGIDSLNNLILRKDIPGYIRPFHVTVIAKNQDGIKDLFRLVSLAHTNFLGKNAQIPVRLLKKYHKNLLFGSSCVNGLFNNAFYKNFSEFKNKVSMYDYIELQPMECYLSLSDTRDQKDDIINTILKISTWCDKNNKTVVVDSDAHYLVDYQKQYRDYFINSPVVGGGFHLLRGKNAGNMRLKATSELFNEYTKYVGEKKAFEYVVTNTNTISDLVDDNIRIIHDKLYTPTDDFLKDKVLDVVGHTVPSVKEELKNICLNEVKKYEVNGKLPLLVQKRLDKELHSIIGNGFQVTYYIAYLLVKKSNNDGYIVGSRGSVGSSFVANLMGITEVNALAPHYYCPECHFSRFKLTDEEKSENGYTNTPLDDILNTYDDGFDLPDAVCPICGKPLKKDGHDIPFETFLGFNGDKVPDIDLNFSGDYQAKAHNFCKTVFGSDHAFKAGTTSTVASKTAFGIIKKESEISGIRIRNCEADRRAKELEGVKQTTGQHPGGIIVIPSNFDVLDFTPVQYPANDKSSPWLTTHFDFHKIHDNVLKLDILGHDDPTMLKYLMDFVKEHPDEFPFNDVKDIPLDDKKVYQLLYPNEKNEVHSLGVPEFGTSFVTQMLEDTKPTTFAQLAKISGLSHGTDVWLGNAKELVGEKTEFGKIPFSKVIGCRDDIMVDLMYMGVEPSKAFTIMEFVRKGKPTKEPEEWEKLKAYMKSKSVPKWYIWSCEKIKYMFPKAHAVAYVLSAMRIAWFKVNKPLLFYAAYLSIRAEKFDLSTIVEGPDRILSRIAEIENNKYSSGVEMAQSYILRVIYEAYENNVIVEKPNLNLSNSSYFYINEDTNSLIAPFNSLDGLGGTVASLIIEEREKNGLFTSVEDFKTRIKSNKLNKVIDELELEI